MNPIFTLDVQKVLNRALACAKGETSPGEELHKEIARILDEGAVVSMQMPVYVNYTNTDCTEGRGRQVVHSVCEMYSTAERVGKRGGVQGTPCHIRQETALCVNRSWLVPGEVTGPAEEDRKAEDRRKKRESAKAKAKAAGLTEEEIAMLS